MSRWMISQVNVSNLIWSSIQWRAEISVFEQNHLKIWRNLRYFESWRYNLTFLLSVVSIFQTVNVVSSWLIFHFRSLNFISQEACEQTEESVQLAGIFRCSKGEVLHFFKIKYRIYSTNYFNLEKNEINFKKKLQSENSEKHFCSRNAANLQNLQTRKRRNQSGSQKGRSPLLNYPWKRILEVWKEK